MKINELSRYFNEIFLWGYTNYLVFSLKIVNTQLFGLAFSKREQNYKFRQCPTGVFCRTLKSQCRMPNDSKFSDWG